MVTTVPFIIGDPYLDANFAAVAGSITSIGGVGVADSSHTVSSGTVVFSNANGVSFGLSGSTMTASVVPGGGGSFNILSASGNTTGTLTTFSSGTVVIAGGNNITLSQSSNSITISGPNTAAQSNQSLGVFATGAQTTLHSSTTMDARNLSISGAGIVTAGVQTTGAGAPYIVVSATVAAQTVQPVGSFGVSSLGNTAGNTGTVTNQIVFSGGNNITLSQSTAAGGVTVGISGPNTASQTVQPVGTFGVSTGGNTAGTVSMVTNQMVLAGGNNITLSEATAAGGVTVSIAGPNTVAQTVQSIGAYATGAQTTDNSSTTFDARSLSMSGAGIVTLGMSTTGAGAPYIVVSATTAAQSNQTLGGYATGANTTAQASSTTLDARSFSVSAAGGGLSAGWSTTGAGGAVLVLSASAALGVAQTNQTLGLVASNQTTAQSSSTTADARSLTFSGGGIVSVGMSTTAAGAPVVVISASTLQSNQTEGNYALGNTVGQTSSTTNDARTVSVSAIGGVSVGYSTTAAGAPLMIISGPPRLSQFEPVQFGNNSSLSSFANSSMMLQHFAVPAGGLSFVRLKRIGSLSLHATFTASTATTGSRSNSWGMSESVILFTRQAGVNSTLLGSIGSTSWSLGVSESCVMSTTVATSEMSVAWTQAAGGIGTINSAGAITTTTQSSTVGSSSAGASVSVANPLSNMTGINLFEVPFATALSAGDYWLGIIQISSSTTAGTASVQASWSNAVLTNYTSDFKMFLQTATSGSNRLVEGNGVYATGAVPSSVTLSSVDNNSNVLMYFNFDNMALQAT